CRRTCRFTSAKSNSCQPFRVGNLPVYNRMAFRFPMLNHIKELSAHESVAVFRALGSSTRARIIELLSQREMNIRELSAALGLTQPSVTKHVQILEEAGIVVSDYIAAPQGTQKRCRRVYERLLVDLAPKAPESDGYAESELPVGMYADVHVKPTCGL